jgi:uracil-DNA glycosylase
MVNKITHCKLCHLHKNQPPTINKQNKSDIMLIGISSQKNTNTKTFTPLDSSTNSGKFISLLEKHLPNKTFYKTNLIKCAPLNSQNKIRYPTNQEFEKCFPHLKQEIKKVNPKTIILLGKHVTTFLSKKLNLNLKKYHPTKHNNTTILPIDHPSYIMIYKRKQLKQYRDKIIKIIKSGT